MRQPTKKLFSEKGAALFTAIFSILLLTILGLSLMFISESSRTIARNNIEASEAFYIAEAGMAHTVGLLKENGNGFDITTVIPSSGYSFGSGTYTVRIDNLDASATPSPTSTPSNAEAGVIVNGDIELSYPFSHIKFLGTNGSLHINGELNAGGSTIDNFINAAQYFSATGSITSSTFADCLGAITGDYLNCDTTTDIRQNAPAQTIEDIQPSSFLSQADYFLIPPNPSSMPPQLASMAPPTSATIYDKAGNVMGTNCESSCWGGWTWNATENFTSGSGAFLPPGTYYSYQTSVKINQFFGAAGSPLQISIISDGNVHFYNAIGYFDAKAISGGKKYIVVAAGDIKIEGVQLFNTSADQYFYTRNQMAMLNSVGGWVPEIHGLVRILNESDNDFWGINQVSMSIIECPLQFGDGTSTAVGRIISNGSAFSAAAATSSPVRLKITSTGVGKNGASATIEAIYTVPASGSGDGGIVVNGDISLNSNLQVIGDNGIIHSNGSMFINGNNRAEEHFSATGNVAKGAPQPCPNGAQTGAPPTCDPVSDGRPSSAPILIPDVKPTDLCPQSDYYLIPPNPSAMPCTLTAIAPPTSATIYDKAGNVMGTNCDLGCWGGWTYNTSQGYVLNGSAILPPGTYYAYQTNLEVNRTYGLAATPQLITFVSDGNIMFSSGVSYFNSKALFGGRKYAAVAGGDIRISGASLMNTEANNVFYARHQFALEGGSPVLQGKIEVYNEADTPMFGLNSVYNSGSAFYSTGDPTVMSKKTSSGTSSGTLTLVSWKEIRN